MEKLHRNFKLSHRLLVYVVLCSTIFTLFATAIQLYIDFKKDISEIYYNIDYIEQSYAPAIAGSVYSVDNEQLNIQLEGVLQLQDITYLEVIEIAGGSTYKWSAGNLDPEKHIRKEIPLLHRRINGETFKCGSLIVIASMKAVYQRLWSKMMIILATNAIKTFLSSFFILLIIKFVVSRHLETLADYARTLNIGSLAKPLKLKRKKHNLNSTDEFDMVVKAINDMRQRIERGIAKREQIEKLLKESEKKYRVLIETQTDLFCRFLPDGRFSFVNNVYCRFFNKSKEELIGSKWEPFPVDDDLKSIMEKLSTLSPTNQTVIVENRVTSGKGEIHWMQFINKGFFNSDGKLMEIQSVGRDVTEKKQAEEMLKKYSVRLEETVAQRTKELQDFQEQLIRSEKMVVLGKLAGVLGHEIKAPLGIMKNSFEFLKIRLDQHMDEKIPKHLHIVKRQLKIIDRTIDDVLDFAHTKGLKLIVIDLNHFIKDTLSHISIPADIHIVCEFGIDLPHIAVDEHQIHQIILNIISNAIDAMDESGTLTVSTGKKTGYNMEQDVVTISIQDTGTGIPRDHLEKIFEPLFTTKVKGTGLGLAACENILHAHKGSLDVTSEPGKGSTFIVKLPIQD